MSSTYTTNLGLQKPSNKDPDTYDFWDQPNNGNFNIIDAAFGNRAYTQQNYISNSDSHSQSLDKLDMAIRTVSDSVDAIVIRKHVKTVLYPEFENATFCTSGNNNTGYLSTNSEAIAFHTYNHYKWIGMELGSKSESPSESPTLSPSASMSPSESPSLSPSASMSPSESPSLSTSASEVIGSGSKSPSKSPSASPSVSPSVSKSEPPEEALNLPSYDISLQWKVPERFISFDVTAGKALTVDINTSSTDAEVTHVNVFISKEGLGAFGVITESKIFNMVGSVHGLWSAERTGNEPVGFSSDDVVLKALAAGDTLNIKIRMCAANEETVKIGAVTLQHWE